MRKTVVPAMKDRSAWHLFCLNVAEDSLLGASIPGKNEQHEEEDLAAQLLARKQDLARQLDGCGSGLGSDDKLDGEEEDEEGGGEIEENVDEWQDEGLGLEDGNGEGSVLGPKAVGKRRGERGGASAKSHKRRTNTVDDKPFIAAPWLGEVGVSPGISLLLQFDQVLTQRLLCMHADWLDTKYLLY